MEDWKAVMKNDESELLRIPEGADNTNPPESRAEDEPSPSKVKSGSRRGSVNKSVSLQLIHTNIDDEGAPPDQEEAGGRALLIPKASSLSIRTSGSGENLPRKSSLKKTVSIDMSTMLKELTKPEEGDLPPPSPLRRKSSIRTRGGGPDKFYKGPPHLSLANLAAEDNFREQDAALKQANIVVAHTLLEKECTAIDVIRVWEEISKFILMKLMEGRAVRIAGLGTFTYKEHMTPLNQKSFKVIKYPLFILTSHLISTYGLRQDRQYQTNVPEVPLNFSVIAHETRLPRGMVDGIITEILQAFARGVICSKPLELPFPGIGKLRIKGKHVTFKFYALFCNQLGFNFDETEEKPTSEHFPHLLPLPGRMTPLKHHIPKKKFRSVFHLREVRSVHEDSVAVRVAHVDDGKYIPFSESKSKKKCSKSKTSKQPKAEEEPLISPEISFKDFRLKQSSQPKDDDDGQGRKNLLAVEREKLAVKKLQMTRKQNQCFTPKPLYEPQPTTGCTLNLMNKSPQTLHKVLEAHMYRVFVETLGKEQVKSHFHRRGLPGISKEDEGQGGSTRETGLSSTRAEIIFNKISPSDSAGSDDKDQLENNVSASAQTDKSK